jgi:hypothetical protein
MKMPKYLTVEIPLRFRVHSGKIIEGPTVENGFAVSLDIRTPKHMMAFGWLILSARIFFLGVKKLFEF